MTVLLGLMLVMLAVAVSGKPKTYLIETEDNLDDQVKLLCKVFFFHTTNR